MRLKNKTNPAFSLVEAVLSIALFVLIVSGLVGAIVYVDQTAVTAGMHGRATQLAEEGIEAARSIRDKSFSNLTEGSFGLSNTDGTWSLSPTPDTTGIFTREINITTVSPGVKEIVSTVTWSYNLQRAGSVTMITRLSDWRKN